MSIAAKHVVKYLRKWYAGQKWIALRSVPSVRARIPRSKSLYSHRTGLLASFLLPLPAAAGRAVVFAEAGRLRPAVSWQSTGLLGRFQRLT